MFALRTYQKEAITAVANWFRENEEPCLIFASVGAGKSLIAAHIALSIVRRGGKVLVVAPSEELVSQNEQEFISYTGDNLSTGAICASLNRKELGKPITYATPGTAINHPQHYDVICFDECHIGDFNKAESLVSGVVQQNPKARVIGLSGTPYRSTSNVHGKNKFFKECVYSITMGELIEAGFLCKYRFGLDKQEQKLDFSNVRITSGRFNGADLEREAAKQDRLTASIIHEVTQVMTQYTGAFIFGASVRHCEEIMSSLPANEARLITGDTAKVERRQAIADAKAGIVKYLVSRDTLFTGINLPTFDVIVWLRPTESRVIFDQGIGRAIRTSPGKDHALILDYAGNIEKHCNSQISNEASQQRKATYDQVCFSCGCINRNTARECEGCHEKFVFKLCESCGYKNDIAGRSCKSCSAELIDPNDNLDRQAATERKTGEYVNVHKMSVKKIGGRDKPKILVIYETDNGEVTECHLHNMNLPFVKPQWRDFVSDVRGPWFKGLYEHDKVIEVADSFMCPQQLRVKASKKGYWKVLERIMG
ncbi:UvsW helicase (plasmid) [Piscirickettsia salmonis]|uniref:DEAD/DEAH box helicase n=1 Tax=Piscirickettsia salmonis TaxID=1238 RepID=UPI0012BB1754|nr:DEAD/DEAH box helicase [Piscirickettsia salmonis]QGP66391.1 UvsW helicase [Piscirickettsia salmonis]